MEIYSKDSSEIIQDIMVCIGTKMATHMRAHGKMMLNKDLVNLSYWMVNITKENLLKVISMGKEYIDGRMEIYMMGIFNRTKDKG